MKERHLLENVKHEMKKTSSSKLDLEESKNAARAKKLVKTRRNQLAVVGKAGGRLSAAYRVVVVVVFCNVV